MAIEPALAPAAARIVGATYTSSDESGDAYLFTAALAKLAQEKGAQFLCSREIRGLRATQKGVSGVVVAGPGGEETIAGDAFVVAWAATAASSRAPWGSRCRSIPPRATRRPCPWPIRTRRRG